MKKSLLKRSPGKSEADMDDQIQEAVTDAITESNDKTVEIKPSNGSSGGGMFSRLLLLAGAFAAGYWLRKSKKPKQKLESAMSETAGRTKQMTEQAAQTIQEEGETMAETVEQKSEKAGQTVEQTAETAAQTTEQAGEKAAEKAQQGGGGSSGDSSGGSSSS